MHEVAECVIASFVDSPAPFVLVIGLGGRSGCIPTAHLKEAFSSFVLWHGLRFFLAGRDRDWF
jgi:hypothetical protein